MRRSIILSIVFMLFSSNTLAHNVFPDSNNNTLNIRINNTSEAFSIPQVRVIKQNLPSWVVGFSPNEVTLGNIGVSQSATATFTFNIASNAQIGASGNIRFQVSAESGDTWNKDIRLNIIDPHGAISGTIDVNGQLEFNGGVLVQVFQAGIEKGSFITSWTGNYNIENLLAGTYTVKASKQGYICVPEERIVRVNHGQTTSNIDFDLLTPPQPPTLRSPANSSTVNIPRPRFDWNTAQGAGNKRYRIQVANNSNFSSPVIDASNITGTDYTPTTDLSNNTTYYWHVQTSNEAGTSSWSSVWNFKVSILPGKPQLSSPSNGTTISSLQPSFDWNDTSFATSYKIQVDDNSNFSSPEIDRSGLTSSSYNHTSNLAVNTRYYWRVQATNAAGDGDWSSSFWFKTPSPPSTPGLSSPSNGSTIRDTNSPTLSWNSVNNVSSYQIQVSKNSSFSPTVIDTTTSNTSYTASNLDNNTTYYWRVKAINNIGESDWSSSWWFRIELKGKIEGDVDGPGNSQSGAIVQAVGPVTKSVTTNLFGGYTISDLPPGNYTVTVSKSGYTSNPASRQVTVTAGQTTSGVDFDLIPINANATIVLSSPSPSTIRNASSYSSYIRALRSIALEDSKVGSLTQGALLSLTTPVTPILSSGEVNALVTTSMALLEAPYLSYAVEGEKPQKVELRGSGANFSGQMFIESTTPEGTATFHYYGVDTNGSVSTQIEYGEVFVIDTTIYADEGGYVANRDGASARLEPGALPLPVNIIITSPQEAPQGPQRSLATSLNLPLEFNDTNYVPLPDSMRQFRVQIDGKEPTYNGRRISTLNEVVNEIKGVTISLPYPDQNQDGIVDNANLDEESLKILQLRNGNWEVIEDSEVDKERNIVSAQVNAFTTFMLTGAKVITNVDNIVAYPNPWYPEKDNFVKITFIPLNSQPKVYIYNIAGELVRTLRDGEEIIATGQGYMEASWDGKNDSGSTVSYGVYIYVVECNKGIKKGKIGVVR